MKKMWLSLALIPLALLTFGCAITDYTGFDGHHTAAEAKLFGSEVAFLVGDPNLDGTYSYTVKYDNTHPGPVTITSYRNPVFSSFSRDGQIDRDGDNVQGRSGTLGGSFGTEWVAVDTDPTPGNCGFFTNITQDKSHGAGPLVSLCMTTNEEIDNDLELQSSFSSFGDLLANVWSGNLTGHFTAELTSITLNGVNVPLAQSVSIGAFANTVGGRPTRLTLDLTQPGGKALIQAILNNTQNGVPATVTLNFNGGMSISVPSQYKVLFNHDALFQHL